MVVEVGRPLAKTPQALGWVQAAWVQAGWLGAGWLAGCVLAGCPAVTNRIGCKRGGQ